MEIIPGKSIGPIQLDMTRDEIAKLVGFFGPDRLECKYDSSGKCIRVSVYPLSSPNRDLAVTEPFGLELGGHDLFDLTEEKIRELFGISEKQMKYEFCAKTFPTIGLCLEWDPESMSSDPFRVSVFARRPVNTRS